MAVVKLFGHLRRIVGARQFDIAAATVREVIDAICAQHPEMGAVLLDDGQELRQYVRVMVNGHDVELGQGLDTRIESDDEVAIFPPIAGG